MRLRQLVQLDLDLLVLNPRSRVTANVMDGNGVKETVVHDRGILRLAVRRWGQSRSLTFYDSNLTACTCPCCSFSCRILYAIQHSRYIPPWTSLHFVICWLDKRPPRLPHHKAAHQRNPQAVVVEPLAAASRDSESELELVDLAEIMVYRRQPRRRVV